MAGEEGAGQLAERGCFAVVAGIAFVVLVVVVLREEGEGALRRRLLRRVAVLKGSGWVWP